MIIWEFFPNGGPFLTKTFWSCWKLLGDFKVVLRVFLGLWFRRTKVLGLRRPRPLCWEKLPNNPVFSLSSAPLEVHLSSKMNTFARLNDNINNFWVFWLVMADFWWVFWWKSQWLKIAYMMKRSITIQVAYFAIWNCQWTLVLTLSFTPFEHSGRVTHADNWHQWISGSSFRCRDIAIRIFCDGRTNGLTDGGEIENCLF